MKRLLIFILSFSAFAVCAQDGILDTAFAVGGKMIFESDNISGQATYTAVQKDGKIVVAGSYYTTPSGASNFMLIRLQPNGSLDYSFGVNGRILLTTGNARDKTTGIAIQEDGKIILGGTSDRMINGSNYTRPHFAILRLLPNGFPDKSFNGTGYAYVYFETDYGYSHTVAIQKNGKILIAGQINADGGALNWDAAIARFNTDGSPDSSFGTNGKIISYKNNGRNEEIWALDFQNDGKIIASGLIGNSYTTRFALYRYHPGGNLDSSFGNNGIAITTTNPAPNIFTGEVAASVKVQKDQKIVTGGTFYQAQRNKPIVLRYDSSGKLDTVFGNNGMSDLPGFGGIHHLLLQNDGKIIAVGVSLTPQNNYNAIALRLNNNGSMDSSFGVKGQTFIPNAVAFSSAFQGNKIIITASSLNKNATTSDWLIARLNNFSSYTSSAGKEVLLYPNPGKNFNLKFSGYEEKVTIAIYDLLGRLISSQHFDLANQSIIEFNTQHLSSSTYLVIIHTKDDTVVKRFIKQ